MHELEYIGGALELDFVDVLDFLGGVYGVNWLLGLLLDLEVGSATAELIQIIDHQLYEIDHRLLILVVEVIVGVFDHHSVALVINSRQINHVHLLQILRVEQQVVLEL